MIAVEAAGAAGASALAELLTGTAVTRVGSPIDVTATGFDLVLCVASCIAVRKNGHETDGVDVEEGER